MKDSSIKSNGFTNEKCFVYVRRYSTGPASLVITAFMNRLLIQEIMESGEPVLDPQGAANTVRWDVPGTYKVVEGTSELVVNTADKIIYHFNFVR
jgi:hypothetical protein